MQVHMLRKRARILAAARHALAVRQHPPNPRGWRILVPRILTGEPSTTSLFRPSPLHRFAAGGKPSLVRFLFVEEADIESGCRATISPRMGVDRLADAADISPCSGLSATREEGREPFARLVLW